MNGIFSMEKAGSIIPFLVGQVTLKMVHFINLLKVIKFSFLIPKNSILELLKKVSYDWPSIVNNISLITNFGQSDVSGNAIKWSLVPLFPNCQSIDLMDYLDVREPVFVVFNFHKFEDFGISFYIQERNRVVKRILESNLLAYSGPPIRINDLGVGQEIRAIIKISQEIDSEKDERAKCKIYPNKKKLFSD